MKDQKEIGLRWILKKSMLVTLLMGFASGLPLLLTLRTLQAWMTENNVDLKTIGFFSFVGLPYNLKFLWAPLMDRYDPLKLGRRKSWLLITQVALIFSIASLGLLDPKTQTYLFAMMAIAVSFFSASQDIVIDAYRRESLSSSELAMGSSFYVYGYRIAMLVSGGLALGLAHYIPWKMVYFIMALFMLIGVGTSLWAKEPDLKVSVPKTLKEAVVEPFLEFIKRNGALLIVAFILLYKIGDAIAGQMFTPFYLKMGYTKLEIAAIAKTLSLPATLLGGFLGGLFVHKYGIIKGLFVFGVAQMISTFSYNLLIFLEHNLYLLGGVVILEDLCTSMATTAFVAFMASMANKKFTATQYALLSSLMSIPRVIISAPSGYLVEQWGWFYFFTFCTFVALPGMVLIYFLNQMKVNDD